MKESPRTMAEGTNRLKPSPAVVSAVAVMNQPDVPSSETPASSVTSDRISAISSAPLRCRNSGRKVSSAFMRHLASPWAAGWQTGLRP